MGKKPGTTVVRLLIRAICARFAVTLCDHGRIFVESRCLCGIVQKLSLQKMLTGRVRVFASMELRNQYV